LQVIVHVILKIEDIEQEILDEFSLFDNWMDKYEYIIELGKDLPTISPESKTKENLIKGCQSQVWLEAVLANNLIYFTADSDAIITKGIIALLVRVLNNQSAHDIMNAKLNFIDEIGLKSHLSPTRANGLLEMVKQMRAYAFAYSFKQ
jgi:cysteine desulfuration protein SufE